MKQHKAVMIDIALLPKFVPEVLPPAPALQSEESLSDPGSSSSDDDDDDDIELSQQSV